MNAILNTSKVGRVGKAGFALALGLLIGLAAVIIGLAGPQADSETVSGNVIRLQFVTQSSADGFEVNVMIKTGKPMFLFLEQEILTSIVQAAAAQEEGFKRVEAQPRRQTNAAAFTLYFAGEIPLDPLKARLAKVLTNLANRPVSVP